jgi:ATP-binding cassette subfamily F protein 3
MSPSPRGARTLYGGVADRAARGTHRLVGANGSGKSTLFAAILELSIDAGTIEAPPPARIAHVAQDIDAVDQPALSTSSAGMRC